MGKTYKDRPDKYYQPKRKPKEKRFESSKGRQKDNLRKEMNYADQGDSSEFIDMVK